MQTRPLTFLSLHLTGTVLPLTKVLNLIVALCATVNREYLKEYSAMSEMTCISRTLKKSENASFIITLHFFLLSSFKLILSSRLTSCHSAFHLFPHLHWLHPSAKCMCYYKNWWHSEEIFARWILLCKATWKIYY